MINLAKDLGEGLSYAVENHARSLLWIPPAQHLLDTLGERVSSAYLSGNTLYLQAVGKGSDLIAIMRVLYALGKKSEDKAEAGKPEYRGHFINPSLPQSQQLTVYLTFTSKLCRRIKIGTKMEEVPVYETVCSEEEEESCESESSLESGFSSTSGDATLSPSPSPAPTESSTPNGVDASPHSMEMIANG